MEKRPPSKKRNAVKQSGRREPQSGNLASSKRLPSNARLKDLSRFIKERDYVLVPKEYFTDVEVIDEISLEQIPWKSVSQHPSGAPDRAVDQVIDRATEVIGNREEAMRWLGMPVRGLDFATPISLLATKEGTERVNDVLGQMEHGVW